MALGACMPKTKLIPLGGLDLCRYSYTSYNDYKCITIPLYIADVPDSYEFNLKSISGAPQCFNQIYCDHYFLGCKFAISMKLKYFVLYNCADE